MATVRDVMTTDVISVRSDTPIGQATKLMLENNISGMPVVEEDMTLVGVITEKDLLEMFQARKDTEHATVSDFMTTPAVHFNVDEDLQAVCDCLTDSFFRRVPVTSQGKLVGVVSRRDILKHVVDSARRHGAPQETSERAPVGTTGR